MTFEDIDERIIKAFAVCEDSCHEFDRIITFEPGGLVGFNAVSSAMGLAKGIAAETGNEIPNFGDFEFGATVLACAIGELGLDLSDKVSFIFAQSTAKNIGASGRQAGKGFADLEDVLFIDDQAVSAAEAGLE